MHTLATDNYITEFWIGNSTLRQIRALARKYHLIIKTLQPYGRMLRLTVAGNLRELLHFVLYLQHQDVILVRSS